jgi:hypothetical protein
MSAPRALNSSSLDFEHYPKRSRRKFFMTSDKTWEVLARCLLPVSCALAMSKKESANFIG